MRAGPNPSRSESKHPRQFVGHPAAVFRRRKNPDAFVASVWRDAPCRVVPARGQPTSTSTIARLQSESERSLVYEAPSPPAQSLAISYGDDDPPEVMKADIAKAGGKAMFIEATAAGWDTGKAGTPKRDWQASRLGPQPPEGMATIADQTFATVLAACGCSAAMFDDSDGTSKREAQRIFLHSTVRPLGKMLAAELSAKLDTEITLNFDQLYMHDLAGRAQAFQKLVAGGMDVDKAAGLSGLVAGDTI